MSFGKIISLFSDVPVLITVLLVVRGYNTYSRSLKVFSWFIFLSGIIHFIALLFWYVGRNNMPVLHIYVALGLPCLIWFYKTVLGDFISSRIMWAIVILFLLFTVINSLVIQDIFRFNSNALVVESIIVVILALSTFIFFLNDTIKETGIKDIRSLTWINSGLFIYYLSCLLIFYFGDTILFRFSREQSRLTWVFHAIFSIVMYTCFIIGLWKHSKTRHS